MKLKLALLPLRRKSLINSGRPVVVEMILGFRSKILGILIKCSLKIADNLLSSETVQSFF